MKFPSILSKGALCGLALSLFLTLARAQDGSFKAEIGLQLYSLRNEFTKDGVPATLDLVKSFGIHEVELAGTYGMFPDPFLEELKKRDLKAVSAHFPYSRWKNDLDSVVKEVLALHLQYAGCAWIDHLGKFSDHSCDDAVETFNKAGEALAKHGVKFFYHTHGYEFEPSPDGTLFDKLVKNTKPEFVNYEMDVFWVVYPGQDPVKLLEKYPSRFKLMHLKDMKKDVQLGNLDGGKSLAKSNDVTIGTGQIDYVAVLKAAQKAGIEHYFIEDESPSSVQQIPASIAYLKGLKW
jgi:sugar phosphate isomerase/epimerase